MRMLERIDRENHIQTMHFQLDLSNLLLTWDWCGIIRFCRLVNDVNGRWPLSSVAIRTAEMTPSSFCEDIVTHIRQVTNKIHQAFPKAEVFIGGYSQIEFGHIVNQISRISLDPFVRAVIKSSVRPVKFARLYLLSGGDKFSKASDYNLSLTDKYCPFSLIE